MSQTIAEDVFQACWLSSAWPRIYIKIHLLFPCVCAYICVCVRQDAGTGSNILFLLSLGYCTDHGQLLVYQKNFVSALYSSQRTLTPIRIETGMTADDL